MGNTDNGGQTGNHRPVYKVDSSRQTINDNRGQTIHPSAPAHEIDNHGQMIFHQPVHRTDNRGQKLYYGDVYENDNRDQQIYHGEVHYDNNGRQNIHHGPVSDHYSQPAMKPECVFYVNASPMANVSD